MNRLKDISKNILIGVISTAIILLLLETTLWVIGVGNSKDRTILANPNDSEKRQVLIDSKYANQLPVSVMHNIVHNELTYPDKELIFKVKSNPEGGLIHGYSGINANGFRGPEIDTVFRGKRIMLLGNSCVFGWGIKDVRRVFGSILQDKLSESDDDFKVYNLGQPGYSTTQLTTLYDQWKELNPDIIVVYAGWNDLWETPLLTDRQTMKLLKLNHSDWVSWIRNLRIYNTMSLGLEAIGIVRSNKDIQTDGQGRGPRVPLNESLNNFKALCSTNAKVVIVQPPFCCLDRLKPMNFYSQQVRNYIGSDASFIQLDSMSRPGSISQKYFQADGFHPNVLGHEYIADVLFETIKAIN